MPLPSLLPKIDKPSLVQKALQTLINDARPASYGSNQCRSHDLCLLLSPPASMACRKCPE